MSPAEEIVLKQKFFQIWDLKESPYLYDSLVDLLDWNERRRVSDNYRNRHRLFQAPDLNPLFQALDNLNENNRLKTVRRASFLL